MGENYDELRAQALNGDHNTNPLASPFYNPTSQQLRDLVLSYLCHHCYLSTAKVFAASKDMNTLLAEAGQPMQRLDNDGDASMDAPHVSKDTLTIAGELDEEVLRVVCLRREIINHIHSGRIETARQLLNTHFPSVLNSTTPSNPTLQLSNGSSAHSIIGIRESVGPHGKNISKNGHVSSTVHTPTKLGKLQSHSSDPPSYTYPLSLNPVHLSLNLHVQSFIESVRTQPLPPSQSVSLALANPVDPFPVPNPQKTLALAQELYHIVMALPPSDQDFYMEEIQNVGALMAYQVPEKSPVAKYLSMFRREAVADQINSAILYRTSQAPSPYLRQYTEHTTVVWSTLEELGATLPPPASYPPGVLPPPSSAPIRSATLKNAEASVPRFDLAKFIASKP